MPNLGVAMVLSFLIPGLGQLYRQQVFAAVLWFLLCFFGYLCFILPGLILHFCCVIAAGVE